MIFFRRPKAPNPSSDTARCGFIRVSTLSRIVASIALLAMSIACGHTARQAANDRNRADQTRRRLLVLESDSAAFFGRPLVDRSATAIATIAGIERETVELERLRMRYLNVVARADGDNDRVLAMLKIAELHLDLGARIRRAPYPPDATPTSRAAFDHRLSQKAVPLEAVSHGLIAQILDLSRRRGLDGRFVRRAELYARMHSPDVKRGGRLGRIWTKIIEREWHARGPFRAPRRLLEAGRIGQRAARR